MSDSKDQIFGPQHDGGQISQREENESSSSSILVTWENAPRFVNPKDWTPRRKWANVALISLQGTLTPFTSTLPAIAAPTLARDFGTTSAILPVLPVALFVLGLGIGPLYLAPLSEIYGRRPVYIISFSLFAVLNVGCALAPNLQSLAGLRFLSGMAGSAGPSLGAASIGDMLTKAKRGKAQAIYGFGPTGGPVLGGVLGGFILHGTGSWRWLMWVTAIAPAVTILLCIPFLRESYEPVLLRKEAQWLRRQHPGQQFRTEHDEASLKVFLVSSVSRPLRLLFTSPICAILALYVALVYGILYLHLLSLSLLFSPTPSFGLFTYGWTGGTAGLSYLGAGVGIFIGTFVAAKYSNRAYRWMNSRHQAKIQKTNESPDASALNQGEQGQDTDDSPESRMLLLQIGMLTTPLGLIMFAWSAGRVHWIVPLLGAAIFASGMIVSYVAFQTYIVDVFGKYAASALATSTILRSVLGCIFSIVGFELYKNLGYSWGTMLLVFLLLTGIPVPYFLFRFGERLRSKGSSQ